MKLCKEKISTKLSYRLFGVDSILITMKFLLILIAYTFSIYAIYSNDVKFYNINKMFGISMRETASVCKDSNGFIWTSSKTGILRLTGDDYRIYSLPYETTDIVNVKLVYKRNNLLAYTNNGQLFRYNALTDQFEFVLHLSRKLNNLHLFVSSVLIDNHENLWISSNMGLFKYSSGELLPIGNELSNLFSIWYDDNFILFKKYNKIGLINIESLSIQYIFEDDILSDLTMSSLYYDAEENKLWVGTLYSGIFHYDFSKNTFIEIPLKDFPRQPVHAIVSYTDSTVLAGIDGQGIWEINRKGDRVLNVFKENIDDPFSLCGNGVYDIFCDESNQIWVCTYSGGLSYLDLASPLVNHITHQINNPHSLINNNVNKVIEDSKGKLWFATDNGISCWDRQENKWKNYYHNKKEQAQVFLSLSEDDEGQIWAGSFSSGVYVIDGDTGEEKARYSRDTKEYSFAGNFIFDIHKDYNGDLWLGGAMGDVIYYDSKEKKFKSNLSLPIYAFFELSKSQMLAACTFGLCVFDKQTGKHEILLDGYLLQDILYLDENVWLCTCGNGLIRFNLNDRTIEKFTTKDGLPSDFLNSIMWANGYLWLGTEAGLCRFNPVDNSVQTFSTILSLSNVSFNHNSHFKLRNGQLMFGTNNGVVLFDPNALQQIHPKGRIFFQELTVSGRSVRESSFIELNTPLDDIKEITLNYSQNNLTLEMIPLGNISSEARFSWKMEKHDNEWTQASHHRILTYTNIPAGRYSLKLKMFDNSLSQLIDERELIISVTPPFWETTWFRLLLSLFLTGILYFSLRFYINRIKQKHTEEKIRFFSNTAHEIRTALTLIIAPIEEINKELNLSDLGKQSLLLVTKHTRRLTDVATQLLDFQKVDIGKWQLSLGMFDIVKLVKNRLLMFDSFAKTKKIEFQYHFTPSTYFSAIDESIIEKVIDNLISNAIKYSIPNSKVEILFYGNTQQWTLEVKDYGIGFDKKARRKIFNEFYRSENAVNSNIIGSGIGLLLVRNCVKLHGGTINCSSQENVGSCFKITIPFREIPLNNNLEINADTMPVSELVFKEREESNKKQELRLLIVEDNDDLRKFMQYSLNDAFDVNTSKDGAEAWEIIQNELPDLIISDIMMPTMDGFELCRLIKSTYETSHIPVVLLSSLTENAQQLHGLGLGADDYLTKPFDMKLLIQRIKSIIQNRKAVREKALRLIDKNSDVPILNNELNDKFVKKAIEVVCSHISDPKFGKDEFASFMNVSASLLYKKIKALTDQSPVDFIKSIRLNHAVELLQQRNYSITEISELCGFSSASYFSTAFRKYFGKSPTEI